jgi:hypothetical protein
MGRVEILDFGFWILDFGFAVGACFPRPARETTPNFRFWILDFGLGICRRGVFSMPLTGGQTKDYGFWVGG